MEGDLSVVRASVKSYPQSVVCTPLTQPTIMRLARTGMYQVLQTLVSTINPVLQILGVLRSNLPCLT